MLRSIWTGGSWKCLGHRWMGRLPGLDRMPKYFPFEGLGLGAEDYIVMYNRHEEVLGHDPLGFFTDRKTLLKVKRNMRILEEIGMSVEQRKAMVIGTWRILEITPSVLTDQIEFYRKRLRLDGVELHQYLLGNPDILNESIANHISPRIAVYKALGIKRARLRRMVLLFPSLLTLKLDDNLVPAMRALAKCNFTHTQGMSVLRNFPHIVGMPHDMIKTTMRLLLACGVDNEEIVMIYKKAARVRLDRTGKYGDDVRWFVTRLTRGAKLGVLVLKEGIACGFQFGKENMRELLEPRGLDWERIWEAIEARRSKKRTKSPRQSTTVPETYKRNRLACQLVRLAASDQETTCGTGAVEKHKQATNDAEWTQSDVDRTADSSCEDVQIVDYSEHGSTVSQPGLPETSDNSQLKEELVEGREEFHHQGREASQTTTVKGYEEKTLQGSQGLELPTVNSRKGEQSSRCVAAGSQVRFRQLTSGTWKEIFRLFLANEHALGDPQQFHMCKQKKDNMSHDPLHFSTHLHHSNQYTVCLAPKIDFTMVTEGVVAIQLIIRTAEQYRV